MATQEGFHKDEGQTTELKPLYEFGEIVGYHLSAFDKEGGLLSETWINSDKRETSKVIYERDTNGRILREI